MRSSIHQPTDRPPLLRFLIMFTGLLAIAVCMAALTHQDEPAGGPVQQLDQAQALRPATARDDSATPVGNRPAAMEVASTTPPTRP